VSFILDALRKSEHERQRSAVPGLSQVPLATPQAQMPRWALAVIGVLGAAVVALGAAWIYSTRAPAELAASPAPTVERNVQLPPPEAPRSVAPQQAAPSRIPAAESTLSAAAASSTAPSSEGSAPASGEGGGLTSGVGSAAIAAPQLTPPARVTNLPDDSVALPSIAMLAAEGVAVPALHLELHAFSAQPKDRFVFINGRKYKEGDRLAEGPMLVEVAPTGAVLTHAGRRFILVQE
jgi:general secretion pathway protein B